MLMIFMIIVFFSHATPCQEILGVILLMEVYCNTQHKLIWEVKGWQAIYVNTIQIIFNYFIFTPEMQNFKLQPLHI